MQNHSGFFCPQCKDRVLLKAGSQKIWHFAHVPGTSTCSLSSGETLYHLQGKKILYEQALKQFPSALLEPYFSSISQRPDLWIPPKIPIEFQCASISPELLIQRTHGYLNENLSPLWILGKKRMKQLSHTQFQLTSLDWMTARASPSEEHLPTLLYFCPLEKIFYQLSSIIPITSTRIFACLSTVPLSRFSFSLENRFPQKLNSPYPIKLWLHAKKLWRLYAFKQESATYRQLKILFLKQRSCISYFPPEAGIPVSYSHSISEPVYIWQSYLLLLTIKGAPPGKIITLSDANATIKNLVRLKLLTIREFPLIPGLHFSYAVKSFMLLLCSLGVLKKVSDTEFIVMKEPVFPRTMDEALRQDINFMHRSVKHGVNILFSGKM